MPKSEAILFGRSPFINEVDVYTLLQQYTTFAVNGFGQDFHVNHLFFFDYFVPGCTADIIHVPNYFNEASNPGIQPFVPKPSDLPFRHQIIQEGVPVLAMKGFCISVAFNYIILNGFNRVYLVGVDHIESCEKFEHYRDNGDESDVEFTPESHQNIKRYIGSGGVQVYQTNPAVAQDWPCEYKDINELYGKAPIQVTAA